MLVEHINCIIPNLHNYKQLCGTLSEDCKLKIICIQGNTPRTHGPGTLSVAVLF